MTKKKETKKKETEPKNELIRNNVLEGTTYKIKTPDSEHAMYITINNVIVDEGKETETVKPFEIFINSKNMEHFMWVVALTRVISLNFRHYSETSLEDLIQELSSVFDPRGGYFKKGGHYTPSLVAEIGEVIKTHMISIGAVNEDAVSSPQK